MNSFSAKKKKKKELPLTATIEEIEAWEERKRVEVKLNEMNNGEVASLTPQKTASVPEITATRTQRSRILAAGDMANFCVAFIALLLFFGPVLGAIAPLSDAMIVGINEGSPAQLAGLQENMVITQVDDKCHHRYGSSFLPRNR